MWSSFTGIFRPTPSNMGPHELIRFQKLNTCPDSIVLPVRSENRILTDKKGFYIFGAALLLLLPFFIYILAKADPKHRYTGTDDCGNFCGYKNSKIDGISCSGKDYTKKPYEDNLLCVETCPDSRKPFLGICEYSDDEYYAKHTDDPVDLSFNFEEALEESKKEWPKFVYSIILTVVLSIVMLVLLRTIPAVVVWGVIVVIMALLSVTTGALWYGCSRMMNLYSTDYKEKRDSIILLVLAALVTLLTILLFVIFVAVAKKIGLVIQLYKEATKVISSLPALLVVPVPVIIVQVLVIIIWLNITQQMSSFRVLYEMKNGMYRYGMNGVMFFTIAFTFIITAWILRFISGIYYMTISGSVIRWFFTRDKKCLDSPIWTSFFVSLKYHSGTAIFGSFLLTLFCAVKALTRPLCRNACCKCLLAVCCNRLEVICQFISENAYIETALHGQSFLRSAKRAVKLLLTNAKSLVAVSCVGDFVLAIVIIVVTLMGTAISYALFKNLHMKEIYIIAGLVNFFVVCVTFSTFQTIMETLFICFCEDSVLNDGESRPFYMSKGLMEFVKRSGKVWKIGREVE